MSGPSMGLEINIRGYHIECHSVHNPTIKLSRQWAETSDILML